jgi:hypothetical protein
MAAMSRAPASPTTSETPRAAFYCVTSEPYFLGAAALINSLRAVGHDEPVFILDCGLREDQRALLESDATIVPAPRGAPPYLLKTVIPMRNPADVMILIDADMIVTQSLAAPTVRAATVGVVAFRNYVDRFVPEWGPLLGLGETRRRPYLSSGLVLLGGSVGARVLELWHECILRADFDLTPDPVWGTPAAPASDPFKFLDQDVLNAILATKVDPTAIHALPSTLAPVPPFTGLRVLDEHTLTCGYADGERPYVLHHISPRKPWLAPTRHGPYSRLLSRLLLADDVAVRVDEYHLPPWMRSGARARLRRLRVNVREDLGWLVRRYAPDRAMRALDERRRRRAERSRPQPS